MTDPATTDSAMPDAAMTDPTAVLISRRDRIRTEMGGLNKLAQLVVQGRWSIRERIDHLMDPGSFEELGTFSHSERREDSPTTPGDGKIGGHGTVDGRPVTVCGDDFSVKRGTSALIGSAKLKRLFEQAVTAGNPFVYFGETGGARIPDTMGSVGFTRLAAFPEFEVRPRPIPVATAILGESFGGSSFVSAFSDFVVQVRGSCLAVTSPRVIEMAIGETITNEELGGVDVHSRITGQIDRQAEDEVEAVDLIKKFLSYLPSSVNHPPLQGEAAQFDPATEARRASEVASLVPARRRRAYDMRQVLERIFDEPVFEIRPLIGRGLITGFSRLDDRTVGVVASQPMFQAGALDVQACLKATRLLRLCDTFAIPVVFLQDTPGFLVGRDVEHGKMLHAAIQLHQALVSSVTPKVTVVVRKAFGLAHQVLNGALMGSDLLVAWPQAEIGFMDPEVGANVVHARTIAAADPDDRADLHRQLAEAMADATNPYAAAGVMTIDEVIEPSATRSVLRSRLARLAGRSIPPASSRPLAYWPTC